MTASHSSNGKWPNLTVEEAEVHIPDGASDRERSSAYATAILRIVRVLPKVVQAIDFLREAGHEVAFEAAGARAEATAAKLASTATLEAVKRVEGMVLNASRLPPMRSESPSSHELLERLDDRVTESFKRKASETPGPMLTGTPPDLAAIAKSAAAELLLEERARIKAEADRDRLAALEAADQERQRLLTLAADERKSDVHKLKQKVIAAVAVWVVLGVLGVGAGLLWVGAKVVAARELGHADAVREMHSIPAPK